MNLENRDYAGVVADAATLDHPEHRALFSHWMENRRGEAVPLRSTFDPLEFHRSMSRMAIIECSGEVGKETFRYRLAGTEIARRAGRDLIRTCGTDPWRQLGRNADRPVHPADCRR